MTILAAEEGASLSSGSLRLYALPYGCVDLYNYDPLNRRCAVGIMVTTEHRRRGHALAMLQALEELAATNYRLHTLYADIAATNTASIALFRKAGYEECGRFKDWLAISLRPSATSPRLEEDQRKPATRASLGSPQSNAPTEEPDSPCASHFQAPLTEESDSPCAPPFQAPSTEKPDFPCTPPFQGGGPITFIDNIRMQKILP